MHRGFRVLALIALLAGTGAADPVQRPVIVLDADGQVIEGSMDWSDKVLQVYGEATAPEGATDAVQRRLQGFRAAKATAFRNLLELVGELPIDAETRVREVMAGHDTIQARIHDLLQEARVVPKSLEEVEGTYRLVLQLALREAFADAVLPEPPAERPPTWSALLSMADAVDTLARAPRHSGVDTLTSIASAQAESTQVDTTAQPAAPTDSLSSFPTDTLAPVPALVTPIPYTGLLVDARGLDLQPCLSPRLISEDGYQVYGPASVERTYATFMGMAGYVEGMEEALTSERIGGEEANPLIVDALAVTGRYGTDAVLTQGDARRLLRADMDGGFLGQCRVVLVVGPLPIAPDSSLLDSSLLDSVQRDSMLLDSLDGNASRPNSPMLDSLWRSGGPSDLLRETE